MCARIDCCERVCCTVRRRFPNGKLVRIGKEAIVHYFSYWGKARRLDIGRETAWNAPIDGTPARTDGKGWGWGMRVGLDLAAGRSSARAAGSRTVAL